LYPLALAEKKQLATASADLSNYESIKSATPILNAEEIWREAEPIQQSIQFWNTKCTNQIVAFLSVQGLVSRILRENIALQV